MADQEHDININHNLDDLIEKIGKSNEGFDTMKYKVSSVNAELMKLYNFRFAAPNGGPPSSPGSTAVPGGSTSMELHRRYERESIKHYTYFPKYIRTLTSYTSIIASMSLPGISRMLMGMGGIAGGAAGLVAGAAGFAIERATSYRDRAAQAAAYGLTPYQQAAFSNVLKDYTGGESGTQRLFGGLVQQETTLGGPRMLDTFLNKYGVKTTGKETDEEKGFEVLRAERKMAQSVPRQQWQTWIDTFGLGSVADINTMKRFKDRGTTEKELEDRIAEARKAGISPLEPEDKRTLEDAGRAWDNFVNNIKKDLDWLAAHTIRSIISGPPTADDAARSPTPGEAVPIPYRKMFPGTTDWFDRLKKKATGDSFWDLFWSWCKFS
jgi:hypothetical protein